MASISNDPNGRRRILFVAPDGKRKTIRLGKVALRIAEAVKVRVEALLASAVSKLPLDAETALWVRDLGDDLAGKLAAVGLLPKRASSRLGEFLSRHVESLTDIKPLTRINHEQAVKRLVEFFGTDKPLSEISEGDADAWLRWLKGNWAPGSYGRVVDRAKQFFKAAVRSRLITANPFADLPATTATDKSRREFISREVTAKVLAACPDAEWRLIVALSRYGGIRVPSELLPLEWVDVLWDQGRFRVHSPKTEHHEGKEERWVPIFPELRPYLEEAFEAAPEGSVHVFRRYRENVNLRTRLHNIIRRAGCTPWQKLFVNLRSSRETELAAVYPLHVVCAWIGNSAAIAQKHYLQVTEADFARAAVLPSPGIVAEPGASNRPFDGAESGAEAAQKAAQSALDGGCQPSPEDASSAAAREAGRILSTVVKSWQWRREPLVRIEAHRADRRETVLTQNRIRE
jgi:integrase